MKIGGALGGESLAGVLSQFRQLDPKDVGAWPLVPRITMLVGILVLILVAGWWFVWKDQLEQLASKQQEEVKLKDAYVDKKRQAVNLDLYVQQLNEIDRSFGALLKQLPNRAEVPALLVEVNQAGLGRGLKFELFRPGGEQVREFYAELPVAIKLTGTYHDLGQFASDIGRLSRIVVLNNISLQSGKDGQLSMDAVAKTFRYLDENELANQRKGGARAGAKK